MGVDGGASGVSFGSLDLREGDEGDSAYVRGGGIGEKSRLDVGDSEGDVGLNGVRMGMAGIAIQTGGDVDGEDLSSYSSSEMKQFFGEGEKRIAEGAFGANA